MVSESTAHGQFRGHDQLVRKNTILDQFGTQECLIFRNGIFSQNHLLSGALRAEYYSVAKNHSYVEANRRLFSINKRLHAKDFSYLSDVDNVTEFAFQKSLECLHHVSKRNETLAYEKCSSIAESYNLSPPTPDQYQDKIQPCLKRLCCSKWWKRNLMKAKRVVTESVAVELQQVHSNASPYCSVLSVSAHRAQKKANKEYLNNQIAINELGQEYSLAELSDLGVSNPAIRRLELITRIKGFELIAKEMKHEALFITLTTPSRFHRMTKITNASGKVIKVIANKKHDGSSPRDAQDYLVNVWAKIQAKFGRENIRPYGFRVAEPHHDSTPHWHFLLFISPEQTKDVISIFERWGLQDSPDEKGAKERRVKVEKIKSGINPDTGNEYSATGYIIKYVCKNIDGNGVNNHDSNSENKDWQGQDPKNNAENIEAWARSNRIRQFQQIGGPSVTVWRELRRLSEQDGIIESIREAADAGDWSAFIKAMGGPNTPRKLQLAKPAYAPSESFNHETGEITEVVQTQYGDEAKARVVGILITGITVLSRTHIWSITESDKLRSAKQKVMSGIADILEEIQEQNPTLELFPSTQLMQQAKPAALDLCQ
jgi:hypothetical protein